MSNALEFSLNNEDFEVDDPNSLESWIKSLTAFIGKEASKHYTWHFETNSKHYDLEKGTQREMARGISNALLKYRQEAAKPVDPDEPRDDWPTLVRRAVRSAVGLEDPDNIHCPQDEALQASSFRKIRAQLEDIVEDYEGPIVDADELYWEISNHVVYKMQELDTSTELDSYGAPAIKFIFVPGLSPRDSIDDISFYPENLSEDPESAGFDALMKLTRADALELMEQIELDHTDTETINKWLKYSDSQPEQNALIPVTSEDDNNLLYLIDNAGCRYGTPSWIGYLTVNQIIALDPLKDIFLSGGSVGINDWTNGAGCMIDLPKGAVITLGQDDWLSKEHGHEMECQPGAISNEPPKPKKKPSLSFDDGPGMD